MAAARSEKIAIDILPSALIGGRAKKPVRNLQFTKKVDRPFIDRNKRASRLL
ncbi:MULTISPECIES: hypothetical protein [unclassified Microcoleus]|uniref:hypothetical protein n=1 Tax=unclassified Microcoleus TaxID=2642155 RepID=UPI002FCFD614